MVPGASSAFYVAHLGVLHMSLHFVFVVSNSVGLGSIFADTIFASAFLLRLALVTEQELLPLVAYGLVVLAVMWPMFLSLLLVSET